MIVDKDIIAQRKSQYGNNFPLMCELFSSYLNNNKNDGEPLYPEDMAMLMALMKVSRLIASPQNSDTMQDMINYMYIATNYEEYEQIQPEKKIEW